jgi:aminoglycoside N3'-acetyltransferase
MNVLQTLVRTALNARISSTTSSAFVLRGMKAELVTPTSTIASTFHARTVVYAKMRSMDFCAFVRQAIQGLCAL